MKPRGIGRPNFRPKMVTGRGFAKSKPSKRNPAPEMYGEDWEKLSLYIRQRDNWTCQIHKIVPAKRCGAYLPPPFSRLLHVHHIIPLPKGSNHPKNLISLCNECHGFVHGKYLGKITDKQKRAARLVGK